MHRESNTDEAAIMRWVLLVRFKRLIFSNEMKSTSCLDSNMIKKLSGGCDEITGRLHCQNETSFKPNFLPCVMANDLPKIKPYCKATNERVRVIHYEKIFVENPSNEFELKKDDNLKNEMKTPDFQRVFLMLMIHRYRKFVKGGRKDEEPAGVIAAKENWIGTSTDLNTVSSFLCDFEITNSEDDFIKSSGIEEWIIHHELGITLQKFANELKKHCVFQNFQNVFNKYKKVNGKTLKVWFGLKGNIN